MTRAFGVDCTERDAGPARGAEVIRSTIHLYKYNLGNTAVLIYTSGTTGKSKGALHAHRVLMGHLPGVEVSHDFLGQHGDMIWTPADWAWIGGLFDVLMPALALGVPVVAARLAKFTPDAAKELLKHWASKTSFSRQLRCA